MAPHPSSPEDPAWIDTLASALLTTPGPTPELPLLVALDEVEQWRTRARADAWLARANRAALSRDLVASTAGMGPVFRSVLAPALDQYTRVLTTRFTEGRVGAGDVASMDAPAAVLREALTSALGIGAMWDDLVHASHVADDRTVAWSLANLHGALGARGHDAQHALQRAAHLLAPGRHWGSSTRDPAPTSFEARLGQARATLTQPPSRHHCVAWLTYVRARLHGECDRFGPVKLFEADWALPNALAEDGQTFDHRDELRALAQAEPQTWDFDDTGWTIDRSRRPYIGLARVDLGTRPTHHALEDAAHAVQLLLDGVAMRHGGRAGWERSGSAYLLVDGKQREAAYGDLLVEPAAQVNNFGQNSMADALEKYGPQVAEMLATPLPAELTEARRMLAEAAEVETRRTTRRGTRAIDLRTALTLQDSAHDHIATYARMDPDKLEALMLAQWPHAEWEHRLARAIDICLRPPSRPDRELERTVRFGGADGLTYSFTRAAEHSEQLVALCDDEPTRRAVTRWLTSIGDAATYLTLRAELNESCALLSDRARRVRNGIVHGNPPPTSVVESVHDISQFRVYRAFWAAIESHSAGRPMSATLTNQSAADDERDRRLRHGVSLLEQWNATA